MRVRQRIEAAADRAPASVAQPARSALGEGGIHVAGQPVAQQLGEPRHMAEQPCDRAAGRARGDSCLAERRRGETTVCVAVDQLGLR